MKVVGIYHRHIR